jgi:hypothetical protein
MNLKRILIATVVIYAIISGWTIATPYFNNAMLSNDIDTFARSLSVDGTVERARIRVLESIRVNEIPATDADITIIKDKQTKQVLIEVKYSVSVSTPFDLYTYTWHFNPRAEKGLQRVPRPGN